MGDFPAVQSPAAILAESTLLIVDDLPENLSVLGELLSGAHYRVRAANSGLSALRLAAQHPAPDLILLDVMMPAMDGFEVLGRLRADPATRDIPVIFLTALSEAEDEQRGLELGAVDYVTKPIKPAVVLARVRTQLDAKRGRDLLRDQNAFLETEVLRRRSESDLVQAVSIRAPPISPRRATSRPAATSCARKATSACWQRGSGIIRGSRQP